jgi:hypothetical protein
VGHFPHVEAPEKFCDVLLDFLATTSPGSTDDEGLREILLHGR